MLILSRKVNEKIVIDNRIILTITQIKNGTVRIGIDAPADVRVDREEIHKRLQEFAEPQCVVVNR
jgi:carbon storage regulator